MAHDPHEFPADLADDPEPSGHALSWAAGVMAIATLLLALTNAQSLDGWANDLPPSDLVAQVAGLTGGWKDRTDAAGLGKPREELHRGWKALEAARWPYQR